LPGSPLAIPIGVDHQCVAIHAELIKPPITRGGQVREIDGVPKAEHEPAATGGSLGNKD